MAKLTIAQQTERLEAATELRELLPEGCPVYSIVRSVARSGMSREISFMVFRMAGHVDEISPRYVSRLMATVAGFRMSNAGFAAIKVQGGGMDMAFHVLDCVRAALGYKEQFRSEAL